MSLTITGDALLPSLPQDRDPRPVLMSHMVADQLGILDRWVVVDPATYEGGSGVASVTEAELLAAGAARVEWGNRDARGWYEPTVYAWTAREP